MENPAALSNPSADVLILCALREEYLEVLNVTHGILGKGWKPANTSDGWLYSEAQFEGADGKPLHVMASYCAFMGREQASATLAHLWSKKPARCIAMAGICAGRRGKVALGDVIFADRLYSYDAGKITTDGTTTKFHGDPVQTGPSPLWVQRMHAASATAPGDWITLRPELTLEEQEDWAVLHLNNGEAPNKHPEQPKLCPDWPHVFKRLIAKGWVSEAGNLLAGGRDRASYLELAYGGRPEQQLGFSAHVAPIATGAAVVEDPEIFSRLSESMRKVLAIDMEGSALGTAAQIMNVPVIVVKGVSDYGDTFKDDRIREFAARASAEYLLILLRQSAELLHMSGSSSREGNAQSSTLTKPGETNGVPRDLIEFLTEGYPDAADARALWLRAGGKSGQIPMATRAFELWQRLWSHSVNGASARPSAILREVLQDFPGNLLIQRYLSQYGE
jgi:nucleoside phosphorylase